MKERRNDRKIERIKREWMEETIKNDEIKRESRKRENEWRNEKEKGRIK